jgi:hypothetical protein
VNKIIRQIKRLRKIIYLNRIHGVNKMMKKKMNLKNTIKPQAMIGQAKHGDNSQLNRKIANKKKIILSKIIRKMILKLITGILDKI